MLDHEEPVGQDHRLERVMGDQHRRPPEVGEVLAQERAYVDPRPGIQRGHRLVEQEHVGLVRHRPGQGHPLRLAAGELGGSSSRERGESQPLQPLLRLCPGGAATDTRRPRREGDVVPHVEVREEAVVLEDHTRPTSFRGHEHVPVLPGVRADLDPALAELGQAGDGAQEGRLAGPVGPEHAEHLARPHGEGEVEVELATDDAAREPQAVGAEVPEGGSRSAHVAPPCPIQRPRSANRTATETVSRTRESTTASSGSVSIAR